jgi:superfamily II helicase
MNKICRVCKVEKPLDEFGVNNNIKSGLNSMCKSCGKEAIKIYRENNPEKVKISQAIQNKLERLVFVKSSQTLVKNITEK